jgi:hypothetical protein
VFAVFHRSEFLTWPIHNNGDAEQAYARANHVEAVGPVTVKNPSSQERQNNKESAICRIHTSEMSRLKSRYDAIKTKDQAACWPQSHE